MKGYVVGVEVTVGAAIAKEKNGGKNSGGLRRKVGRPMLGFVEVSWGLCERENENGEVNRVPSRRKPVLLA